MNRRVLRPSTYVCQTLHQFNAGFQEDKETECVYLTCACDLAGKASPPPIVHG